MLYVTLWRHEFSSTGIFVHFDSVVWHSCCRFFGSTFMLQTSCSTWSQRSFVVFRCGDWSEVTVTFLRHLYPAGYLHLNKSRLKKWRWTEFKMQLGNSASSCCSTYVFFALLSVFMWLSGGVNSLCKLEIVPYKTGSHTERQRLYRRRQWLCGLLN